MLSDYPAIKSAIEIHARHKELFLIDALKVNPGETRDELLRTICPKVGKTSVEFIISDFHNLLSSKSKMLDGQTVRS